MKAQDLMIGDLVTFKDCQQDFAPVIIRIWQINGEDNAFAWINNSDSLDEITIDDDIVGIPITQEILEKNGFQKNYMYFVCQLDEDFELWYYPHLGSLRYEYNGELIAKFPDAMNYVHQLQHALKMCGVDKTIVI